MKELLIAILDLFGLAFWVEIKTDYPRCTYYFGPFLSYAGAKKAQSGYIEDLQAEGSQGINVKISRCKPKVLTIFDEKEFTSYKPYPSFSGQVSL